MSQNARGVYAIIHRPSGRAYVGSSSDVIRRWQVHVGSLNKGRHHSAALLDAWLVSGPIAFSFCLLERCQQDRLVSREQLWLDSFPVPFNTSSRAASPSLDPVVATKIGAANRGKVRRPATEVERMAIRDRLLGHPTSAKTRAKISAALLGRKCPWMAGDANPTRRAEVREKMRQAALGHSVSTEARAKISAALRGRPGHSISEAAKRVIGESNRRRHGEVRGPCPRISDANRRTWSDPEIRVKRVAGIRAAISSAQRSASAYEQWRRRKEQGGMSIFAASV